MVQEKLTCIHDTAIQELAEITQLQKRRALKEPVLNARRLNLEQRLLEMEQEIDDIQMEKIIVTSSEYQLTKRINRSSKTQKS